jgi:thymidylate synthase
MLFEMKFMIKTNQFDFQYVNLVNQCIGARSRKDRTGVGRRSVFGKRIEIDLRDGFPLLTIKQTPFRLIFEELLWMLRGETNVKSLQAKNVHIWDEWADEHGNLGPIYGEQWRTCTDSEGYDRRGHCEVIDQIDNLQRLLRNDPTSSRMLVNAWNVAEIDKMHLPPCHFAFQCFVGGKNMNRLSLQVHQRSADVFLGLPFNIASYALLTHLLAATVGMLPHRLIWTGGDVHLYENHIEEAEKLSSLESFSMPLLQVYFPKKNVWGYEFEDVKLTDYKSGPAIKANVAI